MEWFELLYSLQELRLWKAMEPLKSFTLKNFTFDHDALLFQAMNFISVGCKISLFILREDETPIYQSTVSVNFATF